MTDPAGQPDPAPSAEEHAQSATQRKPQASIREAGASPAQHDAGIDAGIEADTDANTEANARADPAPRWPFAAGSQNQTDKAVKLKPYVPPKRRGLNQY